MSDIELLTTAVAVLERAVTPWSPAVVGLTASLAPLGDSPRAVQALRDHARMCVATLLTRGGTDAMIDTAIQLDDVLGPQPLTIDEAWLRIEEWRATLAVGASRRGRSATAQALASRNGKGRQVIEALAHAGGAIRRRDLAATISNLGDDSSLSHVLRDLETAGLIVRHTGDGDGREVVVELTADGHTVAAREGFGPASTDAEATFRELIAAEYSYDAGRGALNNRNVAGSSLALLGRTQ
jgi:hypothetical protein